MRLCLRHRAGSNHQNTVEGALARILGLSHRLSQSEMFTVHSAKFFLDGVLENRTGTMIEDYSDAIGGNAPLMFKHAQVLELFTAFDAARFQIHIHVIGDPAPAARRSTRLRLRGTSTATGRAFTRSRTSNSSTRRTSRDSGSLGSSRTSNRCGPVTTAR